MFLIEASFFEVDDMGGDEVDMVIEWGIIRVRDRLGEFGGIEDIDHIEAGETIND